MRLRTDSMSPPRMARTSAATASGSGVVTLLVGEVGAAAVGHAATLDDLSTVYEAPAVCATYFHIWPIVPRDSCPS
jgi:hypothetical protein